MIFQLLKLSKLLLNKNKPLLYIFYRTELIQKCILYSYIKKKKTNYITIEIAGE